MLQKYEPSDLNQTLSACTVDDANDDVPSLQKLDVAVVANVTPDIAKLKTQQKHEDSNTSIRGTRRATVIVRTHFLCKYGT